jgi:hypothetical protein
MAKNKPLRSMTQVGESQHKTEQGLIDKFSETAVIAQRQPNKIDVQTTGRISPQISCTVGIEEKKMLDELAIYATNKSGKIVNTSAVLRSLIRLGHEKKGELKFD